jgi:hypothetical protein
MLLAPVLLGIAAQLQTIQYTGVPIVAHADLTLHQVTFTIKDDQAQVRSDSRLVVPKDDMVSIQIPLYKKGEVRGTPQEFVPEATVDDQPVVLRLPLELRPEDFKPTMIVGNVRLAAGNHTLRITYKTVAARTGLGGRQRTFAYGVGEGPQIGRLEFIYHYDQDTVFNVPDMEPVAWRWQTGKTGTYTKREHVQPGGEIVFFTYYTAKVEDSN